MRALLVAGLAFGDESKGATVDALCRRYPVDLVVRYNGGCQAQHAVVLPDGNYHLFSQFGSGMLANDKVRTHLSRFMLVEPLAMMNEADALEKKTPNVWDRVTVDADAVITTPLHSQLNKLRETERGKDRHGSCGRGIGVTRELHLKYGPLVPFAGDFAQPRKVLAEKIHWLEETVRKETLELARQVGFAADNLWTADTVMEEYDRRPWPAEIVDEINPGECMVFEGAQGVMLDEKYGTAPHNTWTNTTFDNADDLLNEWGIADRLRIGCIRTYYTRHGAGPLPTEDTILHGMGLDEPHNQEGRYQGSFRIGWFDWNLFNRALDIIGGVDYLAVSHFDYLKNLGITDASMLSKLEDVCPVGMISEGPTHAQRQFRMGIDASARVDAVSR